MAYGLAEVVDGELTLVDPGDRRDRRRASPISCRYVQTILRVADVVSRQRRRAGGTLSSVRRRSVHAARFGTDYVPEPEEMDELAGLIRTTATSAVAVVARPARQGAAAAHR